MQARNKIVFVEVAITALLLRKHFQIGSYLTNFYVKLSVRGTKNWSFGQLALFDADVSATRYAHTNTMGLYDTRMSSREKWRHVNFASRGYVEQKDQQRP